MIKIGSISEFKNKPVSELIINDLNLLLIYQDNHFYLIENKCGHFGVPLIDGIISNKEITCSQHGIRFSLLTGEVVNRKYENCEMIRIFKLHQQDDDLYLSDE